MNRLVKCVVGILVVLLAGSAVHAKLQLVENFDDLATGNPDGLACTGVMGGVWDSQGEGTGNVNVEDNSGSRVLHVRSHSSGSRRGVGFNGITNPITEGETGTVFLRFWLRANASELPRTYIGFISDASDNPITSTSANTPTDIIAGFGILDNGAGGFDVTTTDGSTVLKAGFVREQWYNIWIVANNETDTFDLYLSEAAGPDGEPTLPTADDLVKSGIPFGNPTTDPLNGMIFTCPTGTGQSTRTYIDEIWWDGDQGLKAPTQAQKPSPVNGATDVPRDTVLSWIPGPSAATHDVYLGTSPDDVANADATSPLLVGPAQIANTYDPGRLEFDRTYYWRIDEVNSPPDQTVFKGKIWSFTTEPFSYRVENIIATASSSMNDNMGPQRTVDGSGLNDSDLHSTTPEDMWLTSPFDLEPAWIMYEFDGIHKLHEMRVWNQNQTYESAIGYGSKDVTIEYSADGVDFVTLGTSHEFAQGSSSADYASNTTIDMAGVGAKYVRLAVSSNWGGILNQYGLSEVQFFFLPVQAREPEPVSGATDVDPDVTLGWRAGREAATHSVYLSADEQVVIDGTAPTATVTDASYSPLPLDLGSTYYWRIDEVNEAETPTTWQGGIWSFSTPEYIVVDDFESYNDIDPPDPESHRIFEGWVDGFGMPTNGALVGNDFPPYTEQNIVHTGVQSMSLFYSNAGGAVYSEAERTFAVPQDWTKYGVQTLALYFHGAPGNTGQLYVKINGVKVVYDGDAAAMQLLRWQQWNIDLASSGASPQSVTKLAVGIDGNGAAGTLYVDDVRLYRLAPEVVVPSEEIWIEAEATTSITMPMEIRDDPTASAGKYITTDESVGNSNDNPPADGIAAYTFTVTGGTYKISARTKVPAGSNSFWVRIQGATIPAETQIHSSGWVQWNGIPDLRHWAWSDVFSDDADGNATALFTMDPGTYTLEIARREDGAQLDTIVISKVD